MKIEYTHDVSFTYESHGKFVVLKKGMGAVEVPDRVAKGLIARSMAKSTAFAGDGKDGTGGKR